jgi:glyoxylase-like metal-dependent hydrolase (beta-lactamase superfamily II)
MRQGYCTEADVYRKDGEEFEVEGLKIKALEVPGHTVGGMCYYFENSGIVFSGDTLFAESIGRTDFPGGSMSALINGIKDKLYTLPDDTVVYPGHAESTTIAREKKYNPFIR